MGAIANLKLMKLAEKNELLNKLPEKNQNRSSLWLATEDEKSSEPIKNYDSFNENCLKDSENSREKLEKKLEILDQKKYNLECLNLVNEIDYQIANLKQIYPGEGHAFLAAKAKKLKEKKDEIIKNNPGISFPKMQDNLTLEEKRELYEKRKMIDNQQEKYLNMQIQTTEKSIKQKDAELIEKLRPTLIKPKFNISE